MNNVVVVDDLQALENLLEKHTGVEGATRVLQKRLQAGLMIVVNYGDGTLRRKNNVLDSNLK
jgi:hypothetical protein